MLNPRHLASLLAIAEHGGFAAAGVALGRSHSAISLHIRALEEEIGATLVDRAARPAALTPDGEAMAEQARRLVTEAFHLGLDAADVEAAVTAELDRVRFPERA